MDVDKRLRSWKKSADAAILRDLVFTPQMEQNVRRRIAGAKRFGRLRQARRWVMGLSLAACTVLLLLPQIWWSGEPDGRQTAERERMMSQASVWQPSLLKTSSHEGTAFSYWGEKPLRLIANRFYEDQVQPVVWLLNGSLPSTVQLRAVHQQGAEIDLGRHTAKGELYDADAHVVTELALPSAGVWRLEARSGTRQFGQLFIEVHAGVSDSVRTIVEPLLTQYLEQTDHPDFSGVGTPRYASMHLIGVESKQPGHKTVYAWVLLEGLLRADGEWHQTAGVSAPMRFTIEPFDGGYRVVEHQLPQDGSLYGPSLQAMFPVKYLEKLNELTRTPELYNRLADELHTRNLQQAEQTSGAER